MTSRTSIREATCDDLPAIRALVGRAAIELGDPGHTHVLVCDDEGSICAVAFVSIDGERGHLTSLAIAEGCAGTGIEDRLIGVAEALCTAFGASTLDVPAHAA